MKRILGLATATAIVGAMVLFSAQTASAAPPQINVSIENYPSSIQPGGNYDVTATVNKEDNLELSNVEVRAYYYVYSGGTATCYSKGSITEFDGTTLYDGWWNDRVTGLFFSSDETSKTVDIPTQVVDKPRDDEVNTSAGTGNEIPVGDTVTLKAKLIVNAEGIQSVSGITLDQVSSGTLTFADGSSYDISINEYNYVQGATSDMSLAKNPDGNWELEVESTKTVEVKSAGGGGLALPLAAKVGIGIVIAVIVIGIAVVKMRGGEEVPA